jgi:NitT/TauT family transport system substrate-binding protein
MMRVVLGLLVFFSFASAEKVRVGLGYLPDVQFAPFYVGVVEKLYEAQGLEVEFQHGFVTELYPLLAQGQLDFVVGDAEDVIALRAQEENAVDFKYLMAMYQQVPTALFSLKEENI